MALASSVLGPSTRTRGLGEASSDLIWWQGATLGGFDLCPYCISLVLRRISFRVLIGTLLFIGGTLESMK